uniref:Anoctamin n=1 Tax=Panagrolaimus superbus TaxID=310955 RepID=A0A914Z3D7_9BILA
MEDDDNNDFSAHVMLQQKLGCIIQDGITEGQRFALSSDLWRCASASPHCDVLITLRPQQNKQILKELVLWLHDIIKKSEPHFDIKIKHHNLTNSYGLYITANYTSLLKGAELCHLKKPIKPSYGGGMRDFTIDEAKCFQGLEIRSNFLSGMERSMIVRQMLQMIKAPSPGGFLFRPISTESPHQVLVPDGGTLLVSLMSQNVIENMLPLHQPEILADLQKRWVFALFDEQPLEDIKEYFGTEIAMYFAWLGHLTTALWTPAIIGVLMFFIGGFSFVHKDNQEENTLFGDICFVIFALINCIWSTAYLEMWKRQQAELAFKWGTYELQTDQFLEDPRPAYKGECLKPNPVSGRLEPFYPPWKHMLIRYGVTFPLTLLCVSFLFFIMFCLLQLQDMADAVFKHSYYFKWIIYLPMIVYALIIVSGDFFYRRLAIILNDLENYRTDDEYENYLIQKIVMFQCVSAFGSLFYIAFYLNDMRRLQETLATLLITRQLTQNIIEIAVPFIIEKFKVARLTYQMTRSMSDHSLQRHVDAARKRRDTFQSTPSSELDETISHQDNADEEEVCESEEGRELRFRKPNGSSLLSVTSSPKRLSSNSEGLCNFYG